MNPMKRLTDKKTIRKRILQSLPIALAAIVVVIYGLSFLPRSAVRMERSVALVEGVTYYELRADGRPVAWFKRLGDSLTLDGLSLKADSSVMTRFYATGCWVDRYPFVPSCRGTLLVANGDSAAAGDSLVVASVPGCTLYGFNPAEARAAVFAGTARGAMRHDVPPLLAPDGSPVFTGDGRLAGFSLRGSIVKPSFFGFGFERLFK